MKLQYYIAYFLTSLLVFKIMRPSIPLPLMLGTSIGLTALAGIVWKILDHAKSPSLPQDWKALRKFKREQKEWFKD